MTAEAGPAAWWLAYMELEMWWKHVSARGRKVASDLEHDRRVPVQRDRARIAVPSHAIHECIHLLTRARSKAEQATRRKGLSPHVEKLAERHPGSLDDLNEPGWLER